MRIGREAVPAIYGGAPDSSPRANILRHGDDCAIIAVGEMVKPALDAADLLLQQGIKARVLDCWSINPSTKRPSRRPRGNALHRHRGGTQHPWRPRRRRRRDRRADFPLPMKILASPTNGLPPALRPSFSRITADRQAYRLGAADLDALTRRREARALTSSRSIRAPGDENLRVRPERRHRRQDLAAASPDIPASGLVEHDPIESFGIPSTGSPPSCGNQGSRLRNSFRFPSPISARPSWPGTVSQGFPSTTPSYGS